MTTGQVNYWTINPDLIKVNVEVKDPFPNMYLRARNSKFVHPVIKMATQIYYIRKVEVCSYYSSQPQFDQKHPNELIRCCRFEPLSCWASLVDAAGLQ